MYRGDLQQLQPKLWLSRKQWQGEFRLGQRRSGVVKDRYNQLGITPPFYWMHVCCVSALVWFCSSICHPPSAVSATLTSCILSPPWTLPNCCVVHRPKIVLRICPGGLWTAGVGTGQIHSTVTRWKLTHRLEWNLSAPLLWRSSDGAELDWRGHVSGRIEGLASWAFTSRARTKFGLLPLEVQNGITQKDGLRLAC